jgi:hypothetical protein
MTNKEQRPSPLLLRVKGEEKPGARVALKNGGTVGRRNVSTGSK